MSKSPIAVPARRPEPPPGGARLSLATLATTLEGAPARISDGLITQLEALCDDVRVDEASLIDASRDWWPLGMVWASQSLVARLPAVVVAPTSTEEVSAVLSVCNEHGVPVTPYGGRSGVLGGSLPVFGGVSLDCTKMSGIWDLRANDLTVDVGAGTFGDDFEAALQRHDYTAGHWPQSIALSTIGGWIACCGSGQMSTRYGTMADIVKGLTVVLADGRVVDTGEYSHSATGPDLTQIFVGSEGALGVITSARLRICPKPTHRVSAAFSFPSFAAGSDAIRRFMRRGATPAVVRLYDATESVRNFGTDGQNVLILHDEGEAALVDAGWAIVLEECDGTRLDSALVDRWLSHRNTVSGIETLIADRAPDTLEVTVHWSRVAETYDAVTGALMQVAGTRTATAHISHAYPDRAGLYFMFGGRPDVTFRPRWYREAWDAATRAALASGANLSHHHGIGLGRSRFVSEALGTGFDVLDDLKTALDPKRILNPGKMGLDSPFGAPPDWKDEMPCG
ncbi:FAD-binding oxidoreductase [Nitratireductor sp. StC3]|uniref:FAD-binding oxidoreductase n=1 Tax=Nitratireductor sp. StC3 TaxID=2126741 RepID=UPI000D0DA0C5|nr:FAD-binding oxidoreductase [Nitratireductor sp. StC3]PSM15811.1 FAD-binding oxidoreductase [Nitratireductor sp. StC3]